MSSLDRFAQSKIDDLKGRNLYRSMTETMREDGIWVERNGRRLLSFSCNDYLGLAQHPALKGRRQPSAAIEKYGVGAGRLASRHRQPSALR